MNLSSASLHHSATGESCRVVEGCRKGNLIFSQMHFGLVSWYWIVKTKAGLEGSLYQLCAQNETSNGIIKRMSTHPSPDFDFVDRCSIWARLSARGAPAQLEGIM